MKTKLAVLVTLLLSLGFALFAQTSTAQTFIPTAGAQSWNVNLNWTGGVFPNAIGASAAFPTPTAAETVSLLQAITVGSITLTNNTAFVFTLTNGAGGSLILDQTGVANALITINGTGTAVNVLSTSNTLTDTLDLIINNTAVTSVTGALQVTGSMGGAGGFIKDGAGTVSFATAAKAYTGSTTINTGVLRTSVVGEMTGTSGVAVSSGGTLLLGTTASGAFQFGTSGATVITLNGNGATTLQGVAVPGGAGALRNDSSGTNTLANNISLATDSTINTVTALTLNGVVSGAGALTKAGSSTLTLSNSNNYSGGTNVNAGTLALGNATNTLADAGAVTVGGGTLSIGANSDTVGAVSLTSGNINGTTGTLTGTSYDVQLGAISAKLGGSGALTKTTIGQVILTGVNSYTGGTNVNNGTLALNASNIVPLTGTVSLGGGTLQLNSTQQGTTATAGAGALALASSSIIDLASTDLIHFLASNGQTWTGTLSIYNWSGTPVTGGGAEQILFGTDATALTAAQLNQITFYSDGGVTSLGTAAFATANNGEIVPTFAPVPEPGTWLAGALVFGTLLVSQRRRLLRKATA